MKSLADSNMRLMSVTLLTSQPDIFWLKFPLLEKSPDMSVTSEVSQSAISAVPASPQSAPPPPSGSLTGLQHLSPVETLLRHFSTAVMSRALLANAAACVVERHAATMLTSKSQWGRVPAQYPGHVWRRARTFPLHPPSKGTGSRSSAPDVSPRFGGIRDAHVASRDEEGRVRRRRRGNQSPPTSPIPSSSSFARRRTGSPGTRPRSTKGKRGYPSIHPGPLPRSLGRRRDERDERAGRLCRRGLGV